jgi:hypothetical protein
VRQRAAEAIQLPDDQPITAAQPGEVGLQAGAPPSTRDSINFLLSSYGGQGLLLCGPESALLHDWRPVAVRKPGIYCSPPPLAQVQQELPFEITSTRLAECRMLPLGGNVVQA